MRPVLALLLALVALASIGCSDTEYIDCCEPRTPDSTFVSETGDEYTGYRDTLRLFYGSEPQAWMKLDLSGSAKSWSLLMIMPLDDVLALRATADVVRQPLGPGRALVESVDTDAGGIVLSFRGAVVAEFANGAVTGAVSTNDPRTSGEFYSDLYVQCWVTPEVAGQGGIRVETDEEMFPDQLLETEQCRDAANKLGIPIPGEDP